MDKWLMNQNVVRVISLLLGILLWWVVHNDEQTTTPTVPETSAIHSQTLNISVDVTGLDEDQLHIRSITPSTVTVLMKGKKEDLDSVNPETTKVILDLSKATAGTHAYPLKLSGFPSTLQVSLEQPTVLVNLEAKVKKEMPVTIDLLGNPADGFQAGTPIITPNRVHVSLPQSQMAQLESVRAQVEITDAKAAVKKQIKLVAYDKNGKEMDAAVITPSIVDVEVPITSPFKTMPLQIQLIGHLPDGYSIASYSQSVSQVTVYGPKDLLDTMDFYGGIQIDLSKITTDKEFSMDIPLQNRIIQVQPSKVDVMLHVVPSATKTFKQVKISITGQNNDYNTQVTDPNGGVMDLTLQGAPQILNKLKPEDIQAIVDVSNLAPGTHQVPLIVNVPQFVEKADPQNVNVTVVISPKTGGSGGAGAGETGTGGGTGSGTGGTAGSSGNGSSGTGAGGSGGAAGGSTGSAAGASGATSGGPASGTSGGDSGAVSDSGGAVPANGGASSGTQGSSTASSGGAAGSATGSGDSPSVGSTGNG